MDHSHIAINFVLDGRPYAARMWPAVPRVGEVVMLRDPTRSDDPNLRFPFNVRFVIWAIREKSWAGEQLECEVRISRRLPSEDSHD